MTSPLVSVILPVRDGGADLPTAVDTILKQTFADFELIAIDDGSSDGTAAVLDGLRDPRVRVIHQDNMGLAATLNRGIALSRGQYIARQDHDDWAMPTRLEKQVAFMEANPDCALVGTRAEIWVGNRKAKRVHDHPTDNAELQFELLFDNPFLHSSTMLRKTSLDAVGGYSTDRSRQPPEDYELWSRLARRYKVANLPERLTIYREMPRSLSRVGSNPFQEKLVLISSENLAHAAGDGVPDQRHRDVAALIHNAYQMISGKPDIDGMCRVIAQAGARIHAGVPGSDVSERVAARIGSLLLKYRLRRAGLHRLRPVVRLLRRHFSRAEAAELGDRTR
jgi:Glycosyl transferase family 2